MRKKVIAVVAAALAMTLGAPLAQADTPSPSPTTTPTVNSSPSATAPAPRTAAPAPSVAATRPATPTPSATATRTAAKPIVAQPAAPLPPSEALYVTPGYHLVNGRYWFTQCEMYSSTTVRCRTSIYASRVFLSNGQWYTQNAWVHNNLTYLPSPRSVWTTNPLATPNHTWTAADGRKWRTECDTRATGKGACRNYNVATVASLNNGKVTQVTKEIFNGIVRFETASVPWVKKIPATAPTPSGVPSATTPKPIITNPSTQSGFRLDARCMTGRAFCISKNQRKMAWVVNGKIDTVLDVRFGSELTPTRNGSFQVNWKSRNHVSSLYHTAMPYAMFFSGGQAIHYSADFAARGYNGASHGCVNVRNKAALARLFDLARVGDKVIVYN